MTVEEVILIRQALTYSVTCLELRLEDTTVPLCREIIGKELDRAKQALDAALRMS